MGKAFSLIRRPLQNWNIENRAVRHLDRQKKPTPAPRHETTKEAINQLVQSHPEIPEELAKKDEALAKMLKGMIVEPERFGEIMPKTQQEESHRALPEDRSKPVDTEFGYLEPVFVRPGRCTVRQALDFLSDHLNDPTSSGSAESIARRYNLDVHRVRHVIKYFHIYNVQMPKAANQSKTEIALLPGIFRKQKSSDDAKNSESVGS